MSDVCDVKWCHSGQPATHHLMENMDDGSWRFALCNECWTICGSPDEDSDHSDEQHAALRAYWRRVTEASRK